jgi:hypothetical protein
MKLKTTSVLLAALLGVFAPLCAFAATLSLPAGTELNVTIDQTLDTKTANVGDRFTARVQPPYPFGNDALAGAIVTGEVTRVQHAGQGTKAALDIKFDTMQLADGSTGPMDAYVSAAQPKTQMKNGARVAAYTIAGMLVGNAIVKTVFAGKHGGEAGAAGGFLLGSNYKADVQFPQGSAMTVKMNQTMAIRRQTQATPHP